MAGRNPFRTRVDDDGWGGRGGYFEAKQMKLEQQFSEEAESRRQLSSIFSGVAIHVNGYTDPNLDEIRLIMSKHGGKFHMYYSRTKTTHVIATNLPHAKRKELKPDQKVVKPQWIKDCLKAKELLPHEPYLLVPLDNGSQNRISGFLVKRKSTDSDISNISTSVASTGCEISSVGKNDSVEAETMPLKRTSEVLNKFSGRSIAPTTDSNFLSEFYSHSRLHFLSTWKMELTEYVRSLQSEESLKQIPLTGYSELMTLSTQSAERFLPPPGCRYVMHIDMDCFFVSVGLLTRPELRGLSVAVTHSSGEAITRFILYHLLVSIRCFFTITTSPELFEVFPLSYFVFIRERAGADPDYERQFYEKKYSSTSLVENQPGTSTKDSSSVLKSSSWSGLSSSEVASCSYEARKAGVKNGMFFGRAKQLCPELRVIPYDFDAYKKASMQLYSTIATFTRHIEAVSCDEALVDISQLVKDACVSPKRIASLIRHAVKEATGCNASAGVGPNIALARMATRRAKPDGEYVVTDEGAKEFMKPNPVKDLPGVGRSTANQLNEMGIYSCGDLQNISMETLKKEFGIKTGKKLHDMSCGLDSREVCSEKERKSVSADVNYGIRLSSSDEAKTFLHNLSKEVTSRLKSINMRGRKVTLKIMVRRNDAPQESAKFKGHGICDTLSKSSPLYIIPSSDGDGDASIIFETVWTMLNFFKVNVSDLRGIGIQVTQLQPDNTSTVPDSASAAMLKKFLVKKPKTEVEQEILSEIVPNERSEKHLQCSSTAISTVAQSEDVTEEVKHEDPELNSSFLDALPPELRLEVQENFRQQKEALERNLHNIETTTQNIPSVLDTDDSNSSSNVLFSGGGKLTTTRSSTISGGSKGRRGGKKGTKTKKSTKSKQKNNKKIKIPKTSPNKLITQMFPVTHSPYKSTSIRRLLATASPSGTSNIIKKANATIASSSSVAKVKRKLEPVMDDVPIEIPDSDEEQAATVEFQVKEENITTESEDYPPSLGGAVSVQEIRHVLDDWITEYRDRGPLKCDVDDFTNFLIRTAVELRDLEKTQIVMKSLHRKLMKILCNDRYGNHVQQCFDWQDAYDDVVMKLQKSVRKAYRGGELYILALDV